MYYKVSLFRKALVLYVIFCFIISSSIVLGITLEEMNHPPDRPDISGPTCCKPGETYTFSAVTNDSDNDKIAYLFDWGDGTTSGWTDYYPSGNNFTINVTIPNDRGTYEIFKTKAIDIYGQESDWAILEITIPRKKLRIFTILNWIIDRIPILEKMLTVFRYI
jgi:hypothetical protein